MRWAGVREKTAGGRRAAGPVHGLPAHVLLRDGVPDRGLEAERGHKKECKKLAAEAADR